MSASDLPLAGLRVVEIGSGEPLAWCGKMFADYGAEVIKVEPPGGDPLRQFDLTIDIGAGRRENPHFAWLNTNKSSITADLAKPADIERVRTLLASADLLLDSRPADKRDASALSHDALRASDPGLAITAIDWFAEHGPYRSWEATEAVIRCLGGLVKVIGPAEGPPILPREGPAMMLAALTAFIPSLAGLYDRARSGARRYASNAQEAVMQVTEYDLALAMDNGRSTRRSGINRFGRNYPTGAYQTKEGFIGFGIVTSEQWQIFCRVIDRADLAQDPRLASGPGRAANVAMIEPIILPILKTRTATEWFELCLAQRLPAAVIPSMKELLAQPVHRERPAFGDVSIGGAKFEAPAFAYGFTKTARRFNGRAPLAGEHNDASFAPRKRAATKRAPFEGPLPLEGLRVVDLTMGWAGPTSIRNLADLGADVIKIESLEFTDWFRGTDLRPPYHAEQIYERDLKFLIMNRNKRGITIDLTVPEGVDLVKRLVASADIVADSYAADVMPRLGLGADELLKINPKLLVVTMPAFGMKGMWSSARAYGSTLEQASGLPRLTGRESDPPVMNHGVFGDPFGGLNAASALLIALMDRRRTGLGQHIDLSQVQGLLPVIARYAIEQSATGAVRPRPGNRHHQYVPHGAFATFAEDNWLTIAVRSDAEWLALCEVMQRPDLAAEDALKTAAGRRQHEDRIEEAISQWLKPLRAEPVMADLQARGIAAGVARTPRDLLGDPHLMSIGHYEPMVRPFIGPHLMPSMAYREDGRARPRPLRRQAPTLGEHNEEILGGELGLSRAQLDDLAARHIIGTRAMPKRPRVRKPAS